MGPHSVILFSLRHDSMTGTIFGTLPDLNHRDTRHHKAIQVNSIDNLPQKTTIFFGRFGIFFVPFGALLLRNFFLRYETFLLMFPPRQEHEEQEAKNKIVSGHVLIS